MVTTHARIELATQGIHGLRVYERFATGAYGVDATVTLTWYNVVHATAKVSIYEYDGWLVIADETHLPPGGSAQKLREAIAMHLYLKPYGRAAP